MLFVVDRYHNCGDGLCDFTGKVDIPNHVNSNPVERKEVDLQITNNNNIIEEVESDSLQDKKNVTGVKNEKPVINSYVAYEERALPGFRRRQLKGPVSGPDDVKNSRIAANHMNEQDKRQASLPIEIFGLSVVRNGGDIFKIVTQLLAAKKIFMQSSLLSCRYSWPILRRFQTGKRLSSQFKTK